MAFRAPCIVNIEAELPTGGRDIVDVQVSAIVPFIVMKSMALAGRLKQKDAWDIYYCLLYYPGGIDAIVKEFKQFGKHGLVVEGLQKLKRHFSSVEYVGPKHVTDFDEITDQEERDRIRRDAFERVQYLLNKLEIT